MTKTDYKRRTPVTNCTCEWKMRINIGRGGGGGGGKTPSWRRQGCLSLHILVLFKVLRTKNWYFQVHRYPALSLYNYVSVTRAVIGRCPWSIRVQINGCRQGKLVFFVLFNMARGFENVCEIISDQSKWKPRKKLSRSYLQRRKMENQRQKELLTTWECLNYKKSSQQLPSCVIATRDSLFCKMPLPLFCFEQEKTLKNFSKKLYTNTIKKEKKLRRKIAFGT